MPYYLKHPEHGVHTCYTPEDVEAHKLIGWVLMEESVSIKKIDGELKFFGTVTPLYAKQERKKPVRKPKVKPDGN